MNEDIERKLASLADWRGVLLARICAAIAAFDPAIEAEVKWRKPTNPLGVIAWSKAGLICTGESYRDKVKLTFARGGALSDPGELFQDMPGRTRRALDLRAHDDVEMTALMALVGEAAQFNVSRRVTEANPNVAS